jgi:autotransporter passenger strand-loop-strand repeat protein
VRAGGTQYVLSGGAASATVLSGGGEVVESGGTVSGTIIDSGGGELVYGTASGGTVNSGGGEILYSGGVASATTINGGLVEVMSGGSIGGVPITFKGGGELLLEASTSFAGMIAGFTVPDRLDLRDIAFVSGTTTESFTQVSTTSGTLTVSEGGHTANLTLLGTYMTSDFHLGTDLHGGTLVTDPPAAAGSFQTTFDDAAPDRMPPSATAPGTPHNYWQAGVIGASDQAYGAGGQTLLATGHPGGGSLLPSEGSGNHDFLMPMPR